VNNANQVLLLAFKEDEGGQTDTWYLDTGASNHMCGRKEMFTELDEKIKGKVSFSDNSKILVKGKGTILIRLKMMHVSLLLMFIMSRKCQAIF